MPMRLAPLTLMSLLLSAPAFAALQPPPGYHAAVGQRLEDRRHGQLLGRGHRGQYLRIGAECGRTFA